MEGRLEGRLDALVLFIVAMVDYFISDHGRQDLLICLIGGLCVLLFGLILVFVEWSRLNDYGHA